MKTVQFIEKLNNDMKRLKIIDICARSKDKMKKQLFTFAQVKKRSFRISQFVEHHQNRKFSNQYKAVFESKRTKGITLNEATAGYTECYVDSSESFKTNYRTRVCRPFIRLLTGVHVEEDHVLDDSFVPVKKRRLNEPAATVRLEPLLPNDEELRMQALQEPPPVALQDPQLQQQQQQQENIDQEYASHAMEQGVEPRVDEAIPAESSFEAIHNQMDFIPDIQGRQEVQIELLSDQDHPQVDDDQVAIRSPSPLETFPDAWGGGLEMEDNDFQDLHIQQLERFNSIGRRISNVIRRPMYSSPRRRGGRSLGGHQEAAHTNRSSSNRTNSSLRSRQNVFHLVDDEIEINYALLITNVQQRIIQNRRISKSKAIFAQAFAPISERLSLAIFNRTRDEQDEIPREQPPPEDRSIPHSPIGMQFGVTPRLPRERIEAEQLSGNVQMEAEHPQVGDESIRQQQVPPPHEEVQQPQQLENNYALQQSISFGDQVPTGDIEVVRPPPIEPPDAIIRALIEDHNQQEPQQQPTGGNGTAAGINDGQQQTNREVVVPPVAFNNAQDQELQDDNEIHVPIPIIQLDDEEQAPIEDHPQQQQPTGDGSTAADGQEAIHDIVAPNNVQNEGEQRERLRASGSGEMELGREPEGSYQPAAPDDDLSSISVILGETRVNEYRRYVDAGLPSNVHDLRTRVRNELDRGNRVTLDSLLPPNPDQYAKTKLFFMSLNLPYIDPELRLSQREIVPGCPIEITYLNPINDEL